MIYEYECSVHGTFEVRQSIQDPPLEVCPECAEANNNHEPTPPPKRILSITSFQLRGQGWARDNYSGGGRG